MIMLTHVFHHLKDNWCRNVHNLDLWNWSVSCQNAISLNIFEICSGNIHDLDLDFENVTKKLEGYLTGCWKRRHDADRVVYRKSCKGANKLINETLKCLNMGEIEVHTAMIGKSETLLRKFFTHLQRPLPVHERKTLKWPIHSCL